LALFASPFLPGKAQTLWLALGAKGEVSAASWTSIDVPPIAGGRVAKPEILFPKPAAV
jgi:methionyl-tRNA synthetase